MAWWDLIISFWEWLTANFERLKQLVAWGVDGVKKFVNLVVEEASKALTAAIDATKTALKFEIWLWSESLKLLRKEWEAFAKQPAAWLKGKVDFTVTQIHKHFQFITNVTKVVHQHITQQIHQHVTHVTYQVTKVVTQTIALLPQHVLGIFQGWIDEFNYGFEKGLQEAERA